MFAFCFGSDVARKPARSNIHKMQNAKNRHELPHETQTVERVLKLIFRSIKII